MADKKILTTIIKRLDRVIALLENVQDTGELSNSTRARLVEMLHISISDVYTIGKESEENENISEPIITPISDEPVHQNEILTTIEEQPIENIVEEQQEIIQEQEVETTDIQHEEQTVTEEPEVITEPETEQDTQQEESEKEEDDLELGSLIEFESGASFDYFTSADLKSVEEEPLKNTPVVEDIAEKEEVIENEIIHEPEVSIDEERIIEEKAQLADLRNQLEEERRRLEEELQSWQKERIKREEEMKAAEQLLATLEAETQKRKAVPATVKEPVVEPKEVQQPVTIQEKTIVNTTPPIAETPKPVTDNTPKKQNFVNDNFSSDDLRTQGITPIPDLTKAIGINDKFQFIKELFGGDSDRYTDTIYILNNLDSLDEALGFIESNFNWDKNNDAVKRIILLVRRRYM